MVVIPFLIHPEGRFMGGHSDFSGLVASVHSQHPEVGHSLPFICFRPWKKNQKYISSSDRFPLKATGEIITIFLTKWKLPIAPAAKPNNARHPWRKAGAGAGKAKSFFTKPMRDSSQYLWSSTRGLESKWACSINSGVPSNEQKHAAA